VLIQAHTFLACRHADNLRASMMPDEKPQVHYLHAAVLGWSALTHRVESAQRLRPACDPDHSPAAVVKLKLRENATPLSVPPIDAV
jgi:hypothetical protein